MLNSNSPNQIPEHYFDLFHKRTIAHLATLMPDGSPHITPMWVDFDGTHILINTSQGYRKDQNMRQQSQVALDIVDPEDPYRWIAIRGRVVAVTTEGAVEHMNKLARRYLSQDTYPTRIPGEVRVLFKIKPEHIAFA